MGSNSCLRSPAWWMLLLAALVTSLLAAVGTLRLQRATLFGLIQATYVPPPVSSTAPQTMSLSAVQRNDVLDIVDPVVIRAVPSGGDGASHAASAPSERSTVTWNNGGGHISGGGLTAAYCCAGAYSSVFANKSVLRGRHYWELTLSVGAGNSPPGTWTNAGVTTMAVSQTAPSIPMPPVIHMASSNNSAFAVIGWGGSNRYTHGDVLMFALDADKGLLYHGLNGQWQNGTPGNGGGNSLAQTSSGFTPYVDIAAPKPGASESDRWLANFGGSSFKFPLPAGYGAYGTYMASTAVAPRPSDPSPVAQQFEDTVTVAGQHVPLPEGKWRELTHAQAAPGTVFGEARVLGRFEQNRLVGMVAVNAAGYAGAVASGFPAYSTCELDDLLFVEKRANQPYDQQRCWWINHASQFWQAPVYREALDELRRLGASEPQVMVDVGFRRADKEGFVTAFYFFDPAANGLPSTVSSWSDSEWHKNRIGQDASRQSYIDKLHAWGKSWAPVFFALR